MRKYVLSIVAGCLCGMLSAQQTYTLQTCLQEGLEKNYAIRISKNEQQIAANNVTAANAGRLPSLDLAAGYSGALSENRTESAEGERGSVSGVYDQTVNAGLDLGWTLFDGFRVQTNYKRLEELRGLGEVNARIAIEDFVAGLTAEYYNYVQQKIRLKNFLYAVSLSKERLRIVEARYRIGNFSRLDLQQARVDFNADSSQYINQQELVQASLIRLNELMAGPDDYRAIDYPVFCNPAETPVTVERIRLMYSAFFSSAISSWFIRTSRRARTWAMDRAST